MLSANDEEEMQVWQQSKKIRRTVVPRSSSHRRAQSAEAWSRRISGDEDQRPQDPSAFNRYDLVELADLAAAAAQLDAKQKSQASLKGQFGQSLGRLPQNRTTSDAVADTRKMSAVLPN